MFPQPNTLAYPTLLFLTHIFAEKIQKENIPTLLPNHVHVISTAGILRTHSAFSQRMLSLIPLFGPFHPPTAPPTVIPPPDPILPSQNYQHSTQQLQPRYKHPKMSEYLNPPTWSQHLVEIEMDDEICVSFLLLWND